MFIQRERNHGRRFRFGFVRFLSREHASRAISALDGAKLGGVVLSVAMAKPPRSRCLGTASRDTEGQVWFNMVIGATPQVRNRKGGGLHPSSSPWRDALLRSPKDRMPVFFSPGEEMMFAYNKFASVSVPRFSDEDLFPESVGSFFGEDGVRHS